MNTWRQDQGDLRDLGQAGELERLVLSADSCSELLRAVAPTPARALTERQRGELTRLVERRWQQQAACASADPVAWYPENSAVRPGVPDLRCLPGRPVLSRGGPALGRGRHPGRHHPQPA
jgi:hypothetical protein